MPTWLTRKSPLHGAPGVQLLSPPDAKAMLPASANAQGEGPLHTWFCSTWSKVLKSAVRVLVITQPKGDTGPSSQAFHAANMKMHSAMDITFTGKADVDFVKGMIPHHAGAIDMAKVEIAFGKDPELKKLAEAIIKAQETEIAQMQEWLKKNGH